MTVIVDRPQHAATPGQVQWLRREVRAWEAEGLLAADQAAAILGRYTAVRRLSVGRLLLSLGGAFVGVGLLWLVAANLDALPPVWRSIAVAAGWVAVLTTGEVLHERSRSPAVVGAVRLVAALLAGAVVFQAAQSLQVPAYEPLLVGCWALAALAHAYLVDAVPPLVVGIVAGAVWLVWQVATESESWVAAMAAVAAAGLAATSLAVVHHRGRPAFAAPWREVGAALALGSLFVAALPVSGDGRWSGTLVVALAAATVLVLAAGVVGRGADRLEPLGGLVALGATVALALWDAGDDVSAPTVTHAVLAVAVYVLLAVGIAVLGILHDSWRLTALATAALVAFTTTQSFAVFARIVEGAWLFVLLGLVLVGTGWGFDRARRELAAALDPPTGGQAPTDDDSERAGQ